MFLNFLKIYLNLVGSYLPRNPIIVLTYVTGNFACTEKWPSDRLLRTITHIGHHTWILQNNGEEGVLNP